MYQYNYNPFDSSPNLFPARQQPQQNQTQQTQQPQQSTQSQNNVILPEVNPTTFIESAKEVNELLKEVVKISNNLINTNIGRKIMEAAQQSNTEEIKRLIESIGITHNINITYTPYGITFISTPPNQTGPVMTSIETHLTWRTHL